LARFWLYLGRETALVQVLVATLFTFATAGLLVSSLSFLRDRQQALLAGLILLGTPFFVTHAATQYPDVPTGFFFLSVLVLLSLARARQSDLGVIALAGLFASLAAWTKNEGMAFTFEVIVVQAVVVFAAEGWRECRRQTLAFAAGALPVLILVVWFKMHLALPNELVPNQGGTLEIFHRLFSRWRLMQTAGAFFKTIVLSPGFGKWVVNPIPLLVLYGVQVGTDIQGKRKTSALIGAVIVCGMAATYLVIFLDLPSNLSLQYYFFYVLDRLLMQLWPSTVLVFFLLLRSPRSSEGESSDFVTKMEQAF